MYNKIPDDDNNNNSNNNNNSFFLLALQPIVGLYFAAL